MSKAKLFAAFRPNQKKESGPAGPFSIPGWDDWLNIEPNDGHTILPGDCESLPVNESTKEAPELTDVQLVKSAAGRKVVFKFAGSTSKEQTREAFAKLLCKALNEAYQDKRKK